MTITDLTAPRQPLTPHRKEPSPQPTPPPPNWSGSLFCDHRLSSKVSDARSCGEVLFGPVFQGWLLEGFPQTRLQALALQEAGILPEHVGESRQRHSDVPRLTAMFGQWCWRLLMMCYCRGAEGKCWTHQQEVRRWFCCPYSPQPPHAAVHENTPTPHITSCL